MVNRGITSGSSGGTGQGENSFSIADGIGRGCGRGDNTSSIAGGGAGTDMDLARAHDEARDRYECLQLLSQHVPITKRGVGILVL